MKEYFDFGQRVIKIIRDVDFSILKDGEIDDNDMVKMMFEPKHGTVIYIAGMFEDNEDCLLCMGAEDGSTEFKVAYYEHFREFEKERQKKFKKVGGNNNGKQSVISTKT